MQFIIENQATIWALIGALMGVATIIVRWTKTQRDDAILDRIKQVINLFAPAPKAEDKEAPKQEA